MLTWTSRAQGIISLSTQNGTPSCGSYDLMKHIDSKAEGYLDISNDLLEQISNNLKSTHLQKNFSERYVIPVVFHVVYNTPEEDIADSVIMNQLEILNQCFRRQNPDTSNTRPEFLDLVGDTQIEFVLADTDPNGLPTNGITHTSTNVMHFGGVLPYGPGQTQEINQWVNDSLFYNYFRITRSIDGGNDAWDTDRYLNIWIGDLRILEPQFNNFEELVYFGVATPPQNHVNWPPDVLQAINGWHQGVIMHYVNIGSNNPNLLPAPYTAYNGIVTTGKILVHEVGHYLGLRHIWGDGDCSMDDYIADTPNTDASSDWTCNHQSNVCIDAINGQDLPDMVENYMDYSSGDCQNSFTLGQAGLMRSVLENYRINLPQVVSLVGINDISPDDLVISAHSISGTIAVDLGDIRSQVHAVLFDPLGRVIYNGHYVNAGDFSIETDNTPGVYFIQVTIDGSISKSLKVAIH